MTISDDTTTPDPPPGPAAALLALRELPCAECGAPQLLDPAEGRAGCATSWCANAGMDAPVCLLLDWAGIDYNPPKAGRPIHQGLPVPWVTPVTEHGPLWKHIDGRRLAVAQREFWCQSCGLPITDDAIAIVDNQGWCLTSAPLHPDCAAAATRHCPRVARAGTAVWFRRGTEDRLGNHEPDFGICQRWRILPPHNRFRPATTSPR